MLFLLKYPLTIELYIDDTSTCIKIYKQKVTARRKAADGLAKYSKKDLN